MNIPINIETLLSGKVVESERVEYKKGWNPTKIMQTVAAFANDFENLGSGYIVVGIEEDNGMPKRPVFGFPKEQFDKIQKEMIGYCNLIRPPYFPRLSLEEIDNKFVLLIWVTAGSNRPYEVPKDVKAKNKDYQYYIRRYSNSVKVNTEQRQELISLTANIPFDDRINSKASIEDISPNLIREHLQEIKSRLYNESFNLSHLELCQQMNLVDGATEHILPKNIALLMFNKQPENFFPYTQIELVEFPEGLSGKVFYEKTFKGTIQKQLKDVLSHIQVQIIKSKTIKIEGQAESKSFFNYPYEAVEEAVANAVYHKNYELREPIEIRILPEAIEIISHGGVDPSVRENDLNKGIIRARRYRNRRIGSFLKELQLTEGKGTGIPTIREAMEKNGSPNAKYDTDGSDRRFFIVELPTHNAFVTDVSKQDRYQDKYQDNTLDINALDVINKVKYEVGYQDEDLIIERIISILNYCIDAKTKQEILTHLNLSNKTQNYNTNVLPAIEAGLLERTIPDKPTSKNQKYITTEKGSLIIQNKNDE